MIEIVTIVCMLLALLIWLSTIFPLIIGSVCDENMQQHNLVTGSGAFEVTLLGSETSEVVALMPYIYMCLRYTIIGHKEHILIIIGQNPNSFQPNTKPWEGGKHWKCGT